MQLRHATTVPFERRFVEGSRARTFRSLRRPRYLKENLRVLAFGLVKVPLIGYVAPRVVELSDDRVVFRIRLRRRTRNHIGSMYCGVLCTGADVTAASLAIRSIELAGQKMSLVFKDMKASFLRRAEGDTLFACDDGPLIREMIAEVATTSGRVERPVTVTATCPSASGAEAVARFTLTLSLKKAA
jgi:acyl-coenzyme A thioesterase PaaI-like protein